MNPNDARSQINHMKEFILHEAREQVSHSPPIASQILVSHRQHTTTPHFTRLCQQASEIEEKAQQEATLEKGRILTRMKSELQDSFSKMKSNVQVEEKMCVTQFTNCCFADLIITT